MRGRKRTVLAVLMVAAMAVGVALTMGVVTHRLNRDEAAAVWGRPTALVPPPGR